MAKNSLYPSYVEIDYHSSYAPHKMIVPTKQWNSGGTYGDFETWGGGSIAADTMVEALVATFAPFFNASVTFDSFTIFTLANPTAPAIPRTAKALAVSGTNTATGPRKATQKTVSAKTQAGGAAKITLLDVSTDGNFDRKLFAALSSEEHALLDEWFAASNGWSGRDNAQPYFFLSITTTINDELRKQYHMD